MGVISLSAQKEAFQATINGAPLDKCLSILVRAALLCCDGSFQCAFYMVNSTGSRLDHITGMPELYALSQDAYVIGADALACGLAVHCGRAVIISDVTKEGRWEPWLWLAEQYDCRAVWSFPVETNSGKIIGTFAMYFPEPREATPDDHAFAAGITQAAAIIISHHQESEERARAEAALRESEGQQRVLVGELQHRTRNLIAVIRSMVESTVMSSADLGDFQERFSSRIAALARVQGLLSRLEGIERISFDVLLAAELSALIGESERISLSGPSGIALRSSTVQTFALALHELTTNAIKYGALNPAQVQGRLNITWALRLEGRERRPWLFLDWHEHGVKMSETAEHPATKGSGRELIERALPYQLDAETSFAMGDDGVHCTIAIPVSNRQTMTPREAAT